MKVLAAPPPQMWLLALVYAPSIVHGAAAAAACSAPTHPNVCFNQDDVKHIHTDYMPDVQNGEVWAFIPWCWT